MINEKVSLFGKGFVGSEFVRQYPNTYVQSREDLVPKTNNVLWSISTTDNYNVYHDVRVDTYTNQILLLDMLEHGRRKFGNDLVVNYLSSWFVYGRTELPATEKSYCDPKGFYSITKRAGEQLLASYCETYDIQYRILRLANVLGIGDKKASLKKNAVQFITKGIVQGVEVKTYKETSFRDFVDVRDCAKAIALVISKGLSNEIYNIGNGTPLSVKEIFNYVRMRTNKYQGTEMDTPDFHKQVQVKEFWLDNSKLMRLGYVQEYSIAQTMNSLIAYYTNNEI